MPMLIVATLAYSIVFQPQVSLGERKSTGNPRWDQAVNNAVRFLNSDAAKPGAEQEASLMSLALLKAGEPLTNPRVVAGITEASDRALQTGYTGYRHIYLSGVDAMLLAEVDQDKYKPALQNICNHVQSKLRADGSWAEDAIRPGDVSMGQYGMLALWAAGRAECEISPEIVDRAAAWHMRAGQSDGGWNYRPGTNEGHDSGKTSPNMTIAAAGSLAIARLLFYGPRVVEEKKEKEVKFGVLEKEELDDSSSQGGIFPDYKPQVTLAQLDARIERAFGWNEAHFSPTAAASHQPDYFFYAFERAASLHNVPNVRGEDWYPVYADGIVSTQSETGAFSRSTLTEPIATSFIVLYLMRSTKQILEKEYGAGRQSAKRGNPFGDKVKEREPTELDLLLSSMENLNIDDIEVNENELADELVKSVLSIEDPSALVGQVDRLKKLVNHPKAEVRRPVYWALGRTGDFDLIPLLLEGLKDPNVDVNIEAEMGLRFIARKPKGFGTSISPLEGLPENASPEQTLEVANRWRIKAFTTWTEWYKSVRPFEQRDGFDELKAATFSGTQEEKKK